MWPIDSSAVRCCRLVCFGSFCLLDFCCLPFFCLPCCLPPFLPPFRLRLSCSFSVLSRCDSASRVDYAVVATRLAVARVAASCACFTLGKCRMRYAVISSYVTSLEFGKSKSSFSRTLTIIGWGPYYTKKKVKVFFQKKCFSPQNLFFHHICSYNGQMVDSEYCD